MLEPAKRQAFRLLRVVPQRVLEPMVRIGSPSYTFGGMCRIEHDGYVLLVQAAYRRHWGLPGGLIRRRETPADGVRREVREEVGIEVQLVGEPIVLVDLRRRLVDFLYRGSLAGGTSMVDARAASGEIDVVRWFGLDELARLPASAAKVAEKLRYFDDHPDGGVVMHTDARRAR